MEAELKAQGERRGRPKQGDENIPVNSPELTGQETREIAAQKAGAGLKRRVSLCKILHKLNLDARCLGLLFPHVVKRNLKIRPFYGFFTYRSFGKILHPIRDCLLRTIHTVRNLLLGMTGQKTREIAADKAGFGNPETYRQAKTVSVLTPVAVAASAA